MPFNYPKPLPEFKHFTERHFWDRVDKRGEDECWPWIGSTDQDGYGAMVLRGHWLRSIRVAWKIHTGNDPAPLLVLHSCDNPSCVNPRHLRTGTLQDNIRDRDERNRTCKGDRHWAAKDPERATRFLNERRKANPAMIAKGERNGGGGKLTEQQVREIRTRYDCGEKCKTIAADYNIGMTMFYNIVKLRNWTHV